MNTRLVLTAAAAALLSACASQPMMSSPTYSQAALPDAVKVPTGHRVALETVGVGQITYECRDKAGAPGTQEWVFVSPDALLLTRSGAMLGKYYGPPATWESQDGSKVSGAQLAVSPAMAGSIPLQLVKANPAMGSGVMTGVSYIQRVNTKGGVAPALPCGADTKGRKEIVKYEADYIFYKPM